MISQFESHAEQGQRIGRNAGNRTVHFQWTGVYNGGQARRSFAPRRIAATNGFRSLTSWVRLGKALVILRVGIPPGGGRSWPVSNRSGRGGDESVGVFGVEGRLATWR